MKRTKQELEELIAKAKAARTVEAARELEAFLDRIDPVSGRAVAPGTPMVKAVGLDGVPAFYPLTAATLELLEQAHASADLSELRKALGEKRPIVKAAPTRSVRFRVVSGKVVREVLSGHVTARPASSLPMTRPTIAKAEPKPQPQPAPQRPQVHDDKVDWTDAARDVSAEGHGVEIPDSVFRSLDREVAARRAATRRR